MRWQLTWGKSLKTLLKNAAKGRPTPALEGRPILYDDLQHVWDAFADLSRSRPVGFDIGAIPPPNILSWLDLHGYDDFDERLELYDLITAMDEVFIEHHENLKPKEKSNANVNPAN